MTAAHCIKKSSRLSQDLNSNDIIVKLGYTTQPYDPNGQDYKVKRIKIHPNYTISSNNELYNDIALITLKKRIEIQEHINPICLPEPSLIKNIDEKDKLTLSGFGLFKNPNTGLWEKPTFLQMTEEIRKLPMTDCLREQLGPESRIFCAGHSDSFDVFCCYSTFARMSKKLVK